MKGHESQDFLSHPLIQEAFNIIEDSLVEQWKVQSDKEGRDEIWYTLQGLNRFKSVFEVAVENSDFDSKIGRN